jgi:LPS export ABC transporter protein LptC
MLILTKYIIKTVISLSLVMSLISCGNDIKEVQDFLADKNLPIGVAKNINLIHTDSGRLKTRLIAPVLNDFSNRKAHPYQEFPEGIQITSFDAQGDSITLTANYTRSYSLTAISEIKDNVVVINHKDNTKLYTDQLFWDQNTHYIYTEKAFKLITQTDTINGKGFESNEDLSKVTMKDISGTIYVNESN